MRPRLSEPIRDHQRGNESSIAPPPPPASCLPPQTLMIPSGRAARRSLLGSHWRASIHPRRRGQLPNHRRGQLPTRGQPHTVGISRSSTQPPTHHACHPSRFLFSDSSASCFLVSIRRLWYNVNISYSHGRNISLCVASIYSFDYEKSLNPQVCLSMFRFHYQLLNVSDKLVRCGCLESSLQFKCSSKSSKQFK
jgi:hypothetical protein